MSSVPLIERLSRFVRLVAHFAGGLLTLAFRFHCYTGQRRLAEIRRWSRKFLRLAGRNRRELAGTLHAAISRHLDLAVPHREPETRADPRSEPR